MLLDRPVTLSMLILALMVFGGLALSQLRMDFLPSVTHPTLTIRTQWPGATAEMMESEVTEVVEAHLGSLAGIQQIRSVSTEGLSQIQVEFTWGQSMDMAYLNVREKLDHLRSELPDPIERPQLFRFNPSDTPIAELILYQPDTADHAPTPGFSLNEWTDQVLCRQLEQLDGVAFTEVIATAEPELQVEVDLQKLASYQLDLAALQRNLASYLNPSYTGEIRDGWYRYTLTIEQILQSPEELRQMPIKRLSSGKLLTLSDVARIHWKQPDDFRFLKKGDRDVNTVIVKKDADADQMYVQEQMQALLHRIRAEYPDLRIELIQDTASVVRYVIENLQLTLWMGALCSFLILYVFLKDAYLPLIIGISIPLCLLTTFLAMYLLDLELNIISMSGLILGVGMFVDNGIVVAEHIHNLHKEGYSMRNAIVEGLKRVRGPVMSSTLTTISVYLPLLLLPGSEGVWFKDQAWTLTLSLMSSWAVTMLILPGLIQLRTQRLTNRKAALRSWFSDPFERWRLGYESMLHQVLGLSAGLGLLLLFLLFLISIGLFRYLPKALMPTLTTDQVSLHLTLPAYYDPASVRNAAQHSFHFLKAYVPDSLIVVRHTPDELQGGPAANPSTSGLRIQFPFPQRGLISSESSATTPSVTASIDSLLERFRRQYQEWNIKLVATDNRSWGWLELQEHPVQLYLIGNDRKALIEKSKQLAERLKNEKMTIALELTQPERRWGYLLRWNPSALQRYHLEESDLISWLHTQSGSQMQTLEFDYKETIVRWYTQPAGSNIRDLMVPTPYGAIALTQLAEITPELQSTGLERIRQAPVLSINTNLSVRDWFFEEQALRKQLNAASRELGVPIVVQGAAMKIKGMITRMGYLLLLSVLLIYVILAIQFEHLLYPLIILTAIPYAWLGGLIALWLGQSSLNLLSFLSALLLSGIAVNDAILKVDVVKHCLSADSEKEIGIDQALATSGRLRFRPVIMTTVTTLLGLVPLLIPGGMGYEFRKPFGLVLIGGLISSTFLTLFLIPLWCKWMYQWGLIKPSRQYTTDIHPNQTSS